MTPPDPSGSTRLAKRRRYRRLMYGAMIAGVLGLIAAESVGYPLVGVGLYWLGVIVFFAILRGTTVTLFDEREREIERRASHITLLLFGIAMIAIAPALSALSELGSYTAPPAVEGALFTIAGEAIVFGVVYLWLRYRP
jgi:uncharacterized membrane protein